MSQGEGRYIMKPFSIVVADPPWSFDDRLKGKNIQHQAASTHYPIMRLQDLMNVCRTYPADSHITLAEYPIAYNALLFLWTTNTHLLDGSVHDLCNAWYFEPKTIITWVKGRMCTWEDVVLHDKSIESSLILQVGLGRYTRASTEHIIIGARGRAIELIEDKGVPNIFIAPRKRHSEKPQEAYDLIEKLVGHAGPKLELFARKPREGWTTWGNELKG